MRTCVVCGNAFPEHIGMGRPPVTCSPECKSRRRQQQRDESIARARKRDIPADAHGTSSGYTYWKCPCARCRGWSAAYQAARREVAHEGEPV